MNWIENILIIAGISLDIFAAMEIEGAMLADVKRKSLLIACTIVTLLQLIFFFGGYFICYETLEGCAKEVVSKAKKAGVVMTPAGAPFPYGKDPKDSVIRIAPSYPSLEDLELAANIFVVCVKLVSIEKLLAE